MCRVCVFVGMSMSRYGMSMCAYVCIYVLG